MLNRITPNMPSQAYVSYHIKAPISTHWRVVGCEEANCFSQTFGWKTTVDISEEKGQQIADYIKHDKTRSYKEFREGNTVTFEFPVGTKCYQKHEKRLDKEDIYVKKGGDFRGNPLGTPTQKLKQIDWIDDFANNQIKLNEVLERG